MVKEKRVPLPELPLSINLKSKLKIKLDKQHINEIGKRVLMGDIRQICK